MSRLIGLRKALENKKVTMMKRHPIREKTDPTRSAMLIARRAFWGNVRLSLESILVDMVGRV